jgi:hypothetical protein
LHKNLSAAGLDGLDRYLDIRPAGVPVLLGHQLYEIEHDRIGSRMSCLLD